MDDFLHDLQKLAAVQYKYMLMFDEYKIVKAELEKENKLKRVKKAKDFTIYKFDYNDTTIFVVEDVDAEAAIFTSNDSAIKTVKNFKSWSGIRDFFYLNFRGWSFIPSYLLR